MFFGESNLENVLSGESNFENLFLREQFWKRIFEEAVLKMYFLR